MSNIFPSSASTAVPAAASSTAPILASPRLFPSTASSAAAADTSLFASTNLPPLNDTLSSQPLDTFDTDASYPFDSSLDMSNSHHLLPLTSGSQPELRSPTLMPSSSLPPLHSPALTAARAQSDVIGAHGRMSPPPALSLDGDFGYSATHPHLSSPLPAHSPTPAIASQQPLSLPSSAAAAAFAAPSSFASQQSRVRPRDNAAASADPDDDDDDAMGDSELPQRKKQRRVHTTATGAAASHAGFETAAPRDEDEEEDDESDASDDSDEDEEEDGSDEEEDADHAAVLHSPNGSYARDHTILHSPPHDHDVPMLRSSSPSFAHEYDALPALESANGSSSYSASHAPLSLDDHAAPPMHDIVDLTDDTTIPFPPDYANSGSNTFLPSFLTTSASSSSNAAATQSAPSYMNRPSLTSSLFGARAPSNSVLPPSQFRATPSSTTAAAATTARAKPSGPVRAEAPSNSVDLSTNNDDVGDVKLGTVVCLVHGHRMCPGKAAQGELVSLVRIPAASDQKGIRVDNVIEQPVGVLGKDVAEALAPLIDDGLVRIVAKVSAFNEFEMKLRIEMYSKAADRKNIEKHMARFPQVQYISLTAPKVQPHPVAKFSSLIGDDATAAAIKGVAPSVRELENDLDALFGGELDLGSMPLAETPRAVRTPLHPYQRQGLAWMLQHEEKRLMNVSEGKPSLLGWTAQRDKNTGNLIYINVHTNEARQEPPEMARGGLLADEMGLGKTLQVLALIAASNARHGLNSSSSSSAASSKLTLSLKRGDIVNPRRSHTPTLVVCPLSVVTNWEQQILHHYNPSYSPALTFYTYHGPNRNKDVNQLVQYDIIITTYNILSQEYANSLVGLGLEDQDDTDEEDDSEDPLAALKKKQSKKKATTKKRNNQAEGEMEARIAPLFEIDWYRVLLDEGHVIRERNTQTSKAARQLKGDRRWVLSGTPLVNRVDDAFALLNFIRVPPFSSYVMWQRIVLTPMKKQDARGMQRLQQIMSTICLRRRKTESINGKRILMLPDKHYRVRSIELTGADRQLYHTLSESGREIFNKLMQADSVLRRYAYVLEMLLRMRQACNHTLLVPQHYHAHGFSAISGSEDRKQEIHRLVSLLEEGVADECGICRRTVDDPVITGCAHFFCKSCLDTYLNDTAYYNAKEQMQQQEEKQQEAAASGDATAAAAASAQPAVPVADSRAYCPTCKLPLDKSLIIGMHHKELVRLEQEQAAAAQLLAQGHVSPSPKLLALLEELQPVIDRNEKAVVFSQWTSFLNVLQLCLQQVKVRHVRLDGTMSAANRAKALKAFEDDDSVKVFLISLKAGGVGLNLTRANHVMIMDPWWNPSTEEQAIDRVHRLGQTREVHVTRFICKNSVEEKILELQEMKRQMTTAALTRHTKSREEQQSERLADLVHLFRS